MFVSIVMVPFLCRSWPRCVAWATYGRALPHSRSGAGFSRLVLLSNTKTALLLLLAGFGSVLNRSPTLEQASSMAYMEPLVGAVRSTSSAQATVPTKVAPDVAPGVQLLELVQQLLDVDGEQRRGEHRALPGAVHDAKLGGLAGPPVHPDVLPLIHKDEDPGDHRGQLGLNLGEEDAEATYVERHGNVQGHHDGVGAPLRK